MKETKENKRTKATTSSTKGRIVRKCYFKPTHTEDS